MSIRFLDNLVKGYHAKIKKKNDGRNYIRPKIRQ